MRRPKVPDVVVRRLPLYLRAVGDFASKDREIISSHELGKSTGLTAAQVRKDLALFGEFGKQGIGYNVKFLMNQLKDILRLRDPVPVCIVGMGHLGQAVLRYNMAYHRSTSEGTEMLRIMAGFDVDPVKVDTTCAGVPIYHTDELSRVIGEMGIKIAVVAVPAQRAQEVVDMCVKAGITAILNFAPIKLETPAGVKVHTADVTLELQSLAFYTH